jgi:hypothetical protein
MVDQRLWPDLTDAPSCCLGRRKPQVEQLFAVAAAHRKSVTLRHELGELLKESVPIQGTKNQCGDYALRAVDFYPRRLHRESLNGMVPTQRSLFFSADLEF